jgi:hypothetical protein
MDQCRAEYGFSADAGSVTERALIKAPHLISTIPMPCHPQVWIGGIPRLYAGSRGE